MIYINAKTGAVLETECIVKGGDWVAQQPKKEKKKTKAESEE